VAVSFISEGENHRPVASHWQTLSHNVVPRVWRYQSVCPCLSKEICQMY